MQVHFVLQGSRKAGNVHFDIAGRGLRSVVGLNIYNQEEVGKWIQSLIDEDRIHDFYVSSYWLNLRAEILEEDKNECQHCKKRGLYKKADTVHHVKHLRDYPILALSKTYIFQGKERRQLVSLCRQCHEAEHPDRIQKEKTEPLTEERW